MGAYVITAKILDIHCIETADKNAEYLFAAKM